MVVDFLGVRTCVDYHLDHPPLSGQVLNGPIEDGKAFFNGDTAEWIGLLKCVLSASGRFVAMESVRVGDPAWSSGLGPR